MSGPSPSPIAAVSEETDDDGTQEHENKTNRDDVDAPHHRKPFTPPPGEILPQSGQSSKTDSILRRSMSQAGPYQGISSPRWPRNLPESFGFRRAITARMPA